MLEFNGDLYACDHFVYREWKIGNIIETPLAELVRAPRMDAFAAMKSELPAACRDCEFVDFCKSGCPKHHDPIGSDPARVNHFCEGYKMFYREALGELRRMAGYMKDGKLPPLKPPKGQSGAMPECGLSSEASAKEEADRHAWRTSQHAPGQTPGRNAPCPCGSGRKYKQCCGRK